MHLPPKPVWRPLPQPSFLRQSRFAPGSSGYKGSQRLPLPYKPCPKLPQTSQGLPPWRIRFPWRPLPFSYHGRLPFPPLFLRKIRKPPPVRSILPGKVPKHSREGFRFPVKPLSYRRQMPQEPAGYIEFH